MDVAVGVADEQLLSTTEHGGGGEGQKPFVRQRAGREVVALELPEVVGRIESCVVHRHPLDAPSARASEVDEPTSVRIALPDAAKGPGYEQVVAVDEHCLDGDGFPDHKLLPASASDHSVRPADRIAFPP